MLLILYEIAPVMLNQGIRISFCVMFVSFDALATSSDILIHKRCPSICCLILSSDLAICCWSLLFHSCSVIQGLLNIMFRYLVDFHRFCSPWRKALENCLNILNSERIPKVLLQNSIHASKRSRNMKFRRRAEMERSAEREKEKEHVLLYFKE